MKHLGDITQINGAEIEPVWCITGGSPCQDLSVAGKRAGLAGARSGLFMEQVRIVKEMREHDRELGRSGDMVRPRFLVWENVPGAFSSNYRDGFGDFGAVLEEIIRIAETDFSLPRLQGKQKWTKCGAIDGDGWSVAWRTHDAQYWGVAQRRRRISVVADFGGSSAGEILFERESLSGNPEQSEPQRKETAGDFAESTGVHDRVAVPDVSAAGFDGSMGAKAGNIGYEEELAPTLNAGKILHVVESVATPVTLEPGIAARDGGHIYKGVSGTLRANAGDNQMSVAYGIDGYNAAVTGDVSSSQCYAFYPQMKAESQCFKPNITSALVNGTNPGFQNAICYGIDQPLQNRMGTGGNQVPITVQRIIRWIVRRLTPLECERLQGFPDGWTDIGDWLDSKGKKHKGESDSPRYKALGNSIALPFWYWMLKRMANHLPEDATLGSLFDGIGGFPLCWEVIHGRGTARWASEIEEFPIAVTKMRFGED